MTDRTDHHDLASPGPASAAAGCGTPAADAARAAPVRRHSTITCPRCGHRETEAMPADACQFFYDCKGCGALLRPRPGDCCVFCSHGDVPCPPIQEGSGGTAPA